MCITAIALLKKYKSVPFSLRDYRPYGCGGDPHFWAEIPAHSPCLNVIGAVCGTGQKLPLHFLQGNFNQWRYHDWLSQEAVPWLQANLAGGINNPQGQVRWQHDGHRSHTTGRVRKSVSIAQFSFFQTKMYPCQITKYLGEVFDGRVWALHSRKILGDRNLPLHLRHPHPHWQRAMDFPPYSPDLAVMDYFVWPRVNVQVRDSLSIQSCNQS